MYLQVDQSIMATLEPLPVFAPGHSLPDALPSSEKIKALTGPAAEGLGNRCVARVGEHFLAKYGRSVRPIEGQNMLFVEKNTTVRVPRNYAIYSDHDAEGH